MQRVRRVGGLSSIAVSFHSRVVVTTMVNDPLPQEVIDRYINAGNRHDIPAMLACLAEDFMFSARGSTSCLAKRDLLPVLAWDAALNGHARVRALLSAPPITTILVSEQNDFYSLLGIGEQSYVARFVVRDGLIHGETIEEMISVGPTVHEALAPVVAWAHVHRSGEVGSIYSDGQPLYNGESARRWVALLQAWRRSAAEAGAR